MGKTSDFIIENGVLKKYIGPGGDVVIPEGVTKLGREVLSGAFSNCRDLKSVTIPSSVTEIEPHVFEGCDSLTSVTIPEGVTEIGAWAFIGCSKLEHITLPGSLTTLGFRAFDGTAFYNSPENWENGQLYIGRVLICVKESLSGDCIVKEGTSLLSNGAFESCSGITHITLPEGVTEISDSAFSGCSSLTGVTIPESVTSIGWSAFSGCESLTNVTIPENVKHLHNALAYCAALKTVILPVGVIGWETFENCSCIVKTRHWYPELNGVVAGKNRIAIQTDDNLADIPVRFRRQALLGFVEEEEPDFSSERAKSYLGYVKKNAGKLVETAFEYPKLFALLCEQKLISAKDLDAYTTEAEKRGDTEKKAALLDYQNKLGTDKVSKARAKKEKAKEEFTDALAERIAARDPSKGIEGMTFVITGKLSDSPKVWKNRDEVKAYLERYGAFLGGSVTKKTDYLVTNDTDSGSEKNKKAKEYGALVISEADFNEMIGRHFKDAPQISIPSWLKEIPKKAFYGCKSLTSVTIPDGVTTIGSEAFYRCSSLTSVTIPESVTSIDDFAFAACPKLADAYGFVIINHFLFDYCGPGGDVVIPESVTSIGREAFYGCESLTSVIILAGVKEIGDLAFYGCESLTSVTIPEGMTSIGDRAFADCCLLTNVTIPDSLANIDDFAFVGCPKLADAYGFVIINQIVFDYCGPGEDVVIPEGVTSIGREAFYGCESLTSVIIPAGVMEIGDLAFCVCENLKSVIIPTSVRSIKGETFGGCSLLTIHAPAGSYAEQYAKENNIPFVAE